MKNKKCVVCKFDICTTNYEAHGIPLCWKHDCECRHFYGDRMFRETKAVHREIISIISGKLKLKKKKWTRQKKTNKQEGKD